MALTGNLEIFPLQEVLRMLARSNKTGCLRIDAGGTQGRVFISNGALTLATVSSDDEFRRQILNSGIVTPDGLRSAELGGTPLTELLAEDVSAGTLTDFVREHVVEGLYRIKKPGYGSFDFMVDMAPRYATGQTFDAEVAVSEAERRAMEWTDIETVLSDMQSAVAMVRELPDENNVTVNPPTWRVLAALGDGNSAAGLADSLGLSLFRAARELAGLIRNDLVEVREGAPEIPAYSSPEPAPVAETPEEKIPTAWEAAPEEPAGDIGWSEPADTEQPAAEVEEPKQSFWGSDESEAPAWGTPSEDVAEQPAEVDEPAVESGDSWGDAGFGDESDEVSPSAEEDAAEPATDSSGGWWAQAMGGEETPSGGDDADAFLESVFSQLDEGEKSEEEDSEETGFSMGLLRRRRMGAMSKDITDG